MPVCCLVNAGSCGPFLVYQTALLYRHEHGLALTAGLKLVRAGGLRGVVAATSVARPTQPPSLPFPPDVTSGAYFFVDLTWSVYAPVPSKRVFTRITYSPSAGSVTRSSESVPPAPSSCEPVWVNSPPFIRPKRT